MSEHTKEPWEVSLANELRICAIDGTSVASTGCSDLIRHEWEANARRIVACVNACEGISTEYLEKFGGTTFNHFKQVKQQRDEIAEALEFYAENIMRRMSNGGCFATHLIDMDAGDKARAALAKYRQPEEAPELFPGTLEKLRDLGRGK